MEGSEKLAPKKVPRSSVDMLGLHLVTESVMRTALAPMDRVCWLLQCRGELFRQGRLTVNFTAADECFQYVRSSGGLLSFWRGNLINVSAILPVALTQLFVGLPLLNYLRGLTAYLSPIENRNAVQNAAVQGACVLSAATVVSLVSYPFDMLRLRRVCDCPVEGSYLFRNSADYILTMLKHPSVAYTSILYRGFWLYTLWGVLYRGSYESSLSALPYLNLPRDPNIDTMVSFMLVCCATGVTYPLQTVRKRLMLSLGSAHPYPSAKACFSHIVKEEGVEALFHGLLLTLGRVFLGSVVLASVV